MSAYAKGLENVDNFNHRVRESLATRKHRVLDDRDDAFADALKNMEGRSDDFYPAIQTLSRDLGWLALIEHQDLVITGTNLVGNAEKAAGTMADSTGKVAFEAVVPGSQTITVTITDTGATLAVTADASAGTITIVHGLGGSGAGGAATAAEVIAVVNAHATAKFMVQATVDTAGDIDADETVTVETTGADPGELPVLQIGTTAVDGTTSKCGITAWTDTSITFDFDARSLTSGKSYVLRLWVDGVLVHQQTLVADSEPWGTGRAGSFFFLGNDFDLAAGGTLPPPLGKDMQTANITGNFVDDTAGGVYVITHNSTSEAQAGQVTFNDQLVIDPTKSPVFEARFKINFAGATFSADQRAVVGLCSVHPNAEDSLDTVVSNLWFRVEGASLNLYIESDDDTLDDDDNDSGVDIADNTFITVRIDASNLDAVKFYVNGALIPQTLDAGALTSANLLQPIFCIQRDAGTEAEALHIDFFRFRVAR